MKKKWYRRKRIWAISLLVIWMIAIQFEWAKFRYNKTTFAQSIKIETGKNPQYGSHTINDKSIHYLELINENASTVLVLVHGSPGALNAYQKYLTDDELVGQCSLLAIDRLGFGYSDNGNAESSLEVQADLIEGILQNYKDNKIILLGHSMGGPVISKVTMDYPELVDGLIMVAPAISADLEPSNTWRKMLNFAPLRWLTPSALRVCNQEIIPLKDELEKIEVSWKKMDIPVTVIQGENDDLVPAENATFAESAMTLTKVKKIIVEGGNHFILWSEIPLVKKEILSMVDSIGISK